VRRFRKRAMELYGYKRRAMKMPLQIY